MTNPVATQGFASRFGTYSPDEPIDAETPPDVLSAWLAAGIVAEAGADSDAAPAPPEPQPPEVAPDMRLAARERPQRRFVEDTARDTPRHRRFERAVGPHDRGAPR